MTVNRLYRIIHPGLVVLLLLLFGCASTPEPEVAKPLKGPGGIPIPSGFQEIEDESVFITLGGIQAGVGVYEGKREPSGVVEFYREILPPEGWTLVASFISKDAILVFTKEHQACVITMWGTPSSTRLEVRVGQAEPVAGVPPPTPHPPSRPAPIPSR
ncbi:MAG: hypothetical protein ACE5G5_03665 [Candidatus Methylomirabilales bacterium]